MAGCGCGSGQQQDLWQPVYADRTVGEPMSKAAATREVALKGGYIREATPAAATK